MIANPSIQQAAFFEWIVTGDGSCVLEAVAGSGKTSTLIHGVTLMQGRRFLGAYNKKIADEIKVRIGNTDNVFVSTMHAAGFGAWRRIATNVKVEERKLSKLCDLIGVAAPLQEAACKLVSLAKQAAFGITCEVNIDQNWYGLIEHFDLDLADADPRQVVTAAKELLRESVAKDREMIDFDDMIYAPLIHNARTYTYDWVLIDEAQDTNASRRALALRMLKRGGRLVAVGDRHQAIYGFTGADSDALDLIGAAVNAKPMPLTVSYRCPTAVVTEAQKYVSHIQAAPGATVGVVRAGDSKEAVVGDAIVCRFNKPLLKLVFELIAAGKPAKIEGRDIGVGLKKLATRWKVRSLAELANRLEDYRERETAKLRAKEKESQAVSVEDKVGCLLFLLHRKAAEEKGIPDLLAEIDGLFADEAGDGSNRVVLSSIHKAKGKEWNNVFWLQTGPSPWARMDWEIQQEVNLCYVAATRAKKQLVLVPM